MRSPLDDWGTVTTNAQPVIRVLHVSEPNEAGSARVVYNLAHGMRAHGVESVVCTTQGPLSGWCREIGIDVTHLPFYRRSPRTYLPAIRAIRRMVEGGAFTVVHAHSSFSGLLVRLARTARFPPVVFQPHAWSFLALRGVPRLFAIGLERRLARRTDMFVFVSDDERRLATERGMNCSPMAVVPNGMQFSPRAGTPVSRQPPAHLVIGCIARLARQKGIDVLLRAVASDRWPRSSTVEVIGDGPERARLEALARRLGVVERVLFLGRDNAPRARLQTWDLFVFPSRYEAGTALALLEAADEGLPIITTDVAGARMLLGDASARVVPVDDPDALAAAVADAVSRWPETVEAAVRDRQHAVATFRLERQMEQMRQVYDSLAPQASQPS